MAIGFVYCRWIGAGSRLEALPAELTARSRGDAGGGPPEAPPPKRRVRPESTFTEEDAEVDLILDKISREGMDSLTDKELQKLRERSRLRH